MLYPPDEHHPPEPPVGGDEVDTLLGYLERQRATFAWKAGGLSAEQLRAALAPSAMTLGGMLKHLARFEDDMSTEWLYGEEELAPWNVVDWNAEPAWDWHSAAEDPFDELYSRWQAAVVRSRSRFAKALAERGPGKQPVEEAPTIRYILLNMIEAYARHNGHADLIRESIDGLTGEDPPTP
jgi:Protein of unknown function (DUF664)